MFTVRGPNANVQTMRLPAPTAATSTAGTRPYGRSTVWTWPPSLPAGTTLPRSTAWTWQRSVRIGGDVQGRSAGLICSKLLSSAAQNCSLKGDSSVFLHICYLAGHSKMYYFSVFGKSKIWESELKETGRGWLQCPTNTKSQCFCSNHRSVRIV